jgi:hypothetical protein
MDAAWAAESRLTPDAAEFVRFCYQRRGIGWPELYDEMCAVASRGLFRGWGPDELARHGVGFGLFELPALAGLVARIVAEEPSPGRDRGRRGARPAEVVRTGPSPEAEAARAGEGTLRDDPVPMLRPRFAPAAS